MDRFNPHIPPKGQKNAEMFRNNLAVGKLTDGKVTSGLDAFYSVAKEIRD